MKELKDLEKNIISLERQLSDLRDRRVELLTYFKEEINHSDIDSSIDDVNKGTWKFLVDTKEVIWSNELYEIFEFDKTIKGKDLYDKYFSVIPKKDQQVLQKSIENVLSGKEKDYYILHEIKLTNKKSKWISCSGFPIYKIDKIIGISGSVIEITSHFGEAQSLNHFFDQSVDLQCIANNKGYFLKISPSWSELLGYTSAELCSQPFVNFVHPDDRDKTAEEAEQLDDGSPTLKFENRYIKKNGGVVHLNWNSRKDELNGLFYCTARDVTNEKLLQEALKKEANEKDTLLREIHHRVKNNLQIISSLLSLQAKMKYDKRSINQLLLESQNRVKAMAAIHENFYQAKDVAKLHFNNYTNKLVNDLIFAYQGNQTQLITKFKMDECKLDLDTAVPLGLIINEIVSNSLKHAFIDQKNSEFIISLSLKNNTDDFTIVLGDNGVGCEIDFEKENDDSLGLIIVTGLVEQIGAEIKQLKDKKGTWIELIISKS
jgi:PAS domain S-box-containing protein